MNLIKKGLTTFDLKMLGIILMVFDHIHQMLYFEGVPLWLNMLGRLVAPIFLFLSAEGFHYTHNRKRYMLNLLIGYWICQFLFYGVSALFPNEKVQLINSIFGTLFLSLCAMWIYDGFFGPEKYVKKAVLGLIAFIGVTPLSFFLLTLDFIPQTLRTGYLKYIPNLLTVGGGLPYILLALLFYVFRDKRWAQYLALFSLSLLVFISDPKGTQWLMVFSLIPIYLYNGQKGRSEKWFFYIFYPAHIVILYLISTIYFV